MKPAKGSIARLGGLAVLWASCAFAGEMTTGGIIPYFADGAGWSTTFVMSCFTSPRCVFQFSFISSDGQNIAIPVRMTLPSPQGEIQLTVTDSRLNFTLDAGTLAVIETLGTGPNVITGGVDVLSNSLLGGVALFRQRVPGRPDFEASVIMESRTPATAIVVPFDNRNGHTTGVAVTNLTNDRNAAIVVTVTDANNAILNTTTISLPALNGTAFDVSARFPQTAGKAGLLRFSAAPAFIAGTAFRFNPSGPFATTPVYNIR
jgi:hypothetical protein